MPGYFQEVQYSPAGCFRIRDEVFVFHLEHVQLQQAGVLPPQAEDPVIQVGAVLQGEEACVCRGFVEGLHEAAQHAVRRVAQHEYEPGLRKDAVDFTCVHGVEGEPVYQCDTVFQPCMTRQRVEIGLPEVFYIPVLQVRQCFQAFIRGPR